MARLARVVAPGVPHHVTQRGNRRQKTFFGDDDTRLYVELRGDWCARCGVKVWATCLMPNHSHLIAVPDHERALTRAIGEPHRRTTRHVNFREGWRGHLWQGRFASFPMDDGHLLAVARTVELNPVRARMVRAPEDHRWSSASAHLRGRDDALVTVAPLLRRVADWEAFLASGLDAEDHAALRSHERAGRAARRGGIHGQARKPARAKPQKGQAGPQAGSGTN